MKRIFKYKLDVDGIPTIIEGKIARILSVQYQKGLGVMLWAEVDDKREDIKFTVVPIGTGWPIPSNLERWDYIGTAQENGYVWHYYAEPYVEVVPFYDLQALLKESEE